MTQLLAQARSASVQASSPSAQDKAAAAQVGDCNWNWREINHMFDYAGILYNNPIQLVHREAADIWPDRETLLISIGTGNAPGKSFKGCLKAIVERMREIVTQTERTANDFHLHHTDMVNHRLLFRFNVHGMATIGLEEYNELDSIVDRTETYLHDGEVRDKLKTCVARMKEVSSKGFMRSNGTVKKETLESLNRPATRNRIEDIESACSDTFEWVFEPRIVSFEPWLGTTTAGTNQPIYWIQGKPGSGKSTLMKYILDSAQTMEVLRRNDCGHWILTGFFIHGRGSSIEKTLDGLLHTLLYDLLRQVEELNSIIYPLYTTEVKPCSPPKWTTRILQRAVKEIIQQRTIHVNLCLLVDVLDEFEGKHSALAAFLIDLANLSSSGVVNLKICLASRPWNVFCNAFQPFHTFSIHEHTQKDIETYGVAKLSLRVRAQSSISSFCKSTILGEIFEKACGSFLWVRLVTERLLEGWEDGDGEAQLLRRLKALPEEIEDLYGQILRSVKSQYAHETLIMLQIRLCLYEDEYYTAQAQEFLNIVAIASGEEPRWTNSIFDPTHPMLDEAKRYVFSRGGGLLEIFEDQEWKVWAAECQMRGERLSRQPTPSLPNLCIQFIHHTVKSYLAEVTNWKTLLQLSLPVQELESGHVYLFRHGLQHPQTDTNLTWHYAKLAELQTGKSQIQLLKDSNSLEIEVRKVFRETQALKDANVPSYSVTNLHQLLNHQPQYTLISLAVAANSLCFMQALLQANLNVNIEKNGRPLLHYAIRPFFQDFQGLRAQAVYFDSAEGRADMVKLLLNHGVNVDAKFRGLTALHVILHTGEFDIRYNASEGKNRMLPRFSSIQSQYENDLLRLIVPILLQNGADPNAGDRWGYSALGIALRRYQNNDNIDVDIIQVLLSNGADLKRLGDGCSIWILEVLARNQYRHLRNTSAKRLRLLETLQEYGISVYDLKDQDPLAIAVDGFEEVESFSEREDALSFLSLIKYILQRGPRPETVDPQAKTPLHFMLTRIRVGTLRHDLIMTLLEAGVTVKSILPYVGPSFEYILLYAFTDFPRDLARSYMLIRAVLKGGVDPNEKKGYCPIRFLLGWRIEPINIDGWLPFADRRLIRQRNKFYIPRLAEEEVHLWEEIVVLLLKYQANPNLPDKTGTTAWDRAKQADEAATTARDGAKHARCLQLLHAHSRFPEVRRSKRLKVSLSQGVGNNTTVPSCGNSS